MLRLLLVRGQPLISTQPPTTLILHNYPPAEITKRLVATSSWYRAKVSLYFIYVKVSGYLCVCVCVCVVYVCLCVLMI